jgi:hypothetical protein
MRTPVISPRRAFAALSLAATLNVVPAVADAQLSATGDFRVWEEDRGSRLQLELSNARDKSRNYSSTGFTISASQLPGLTRAQLESSGTSPLHFTLTRDAGTFTFDGEVRNGQGTGSYAFTGDARYADALVQRGYERPDDTEQVRLALGDVSLAFVDELKAEGYRQSTLADLARAGLHGVDIDYVRDMRSSGYRLGDLRTLIRFRDHGVDPDYIAELKKAGYADLPAEQLVRFRDHGVDGAYIGDLAEAGYTHQPPSELLRARDHGVTGSFIKGFKAAGYTSLTLPELVRLQDHGVTGSFARRERERGGSHVPSAEELVYARNHPER